MYIDKMKIKEQIETARRLDALLILGGEGENHTRADHATSIFYSVMKSRDYPLYLIPTGYWSGMSDKIQEKAESELIKEYLASNGIPEEVIINEDKSKDTLANFIFSWPIL